MALDKLLQNIRGSSSPVAIIAVTTIAVIAISSYCLSSGWFIISQNLFYVPIIIACVFYAKRGFAFSVLLSFFYFVLIAAFTRDSAVIIQALIRVCIFIGIAGVATFLSIKRNHLEEVLQRTNDELERCVADRAQALMRVNEELQAEIARHKRAEEVLRENEELFRMLLDSTNEAIYGMDMQGKCIFVNAACCRILGYDSPEFFIGKNMHALFHHSHPDGTAYAIADCRIFNAACKGQKAHLDGEVLWKADGTSFPTEYWSYPIMREGSSEGVVATFIDITERRQTEQMQRQHRKELSHVNHLATVGEFAASIVHEINQPFTAILNNAYAVQGFLAAGVPNSEDVNGAIEDIISDDRRASELIRHLRFFLKKQEADRALLDMNIIIGEVLTMLHGEIADRSISVIQELSPALFLVEGCRVELQQVLMNLILNGCDAMLNIDIQQRQMRIRTAANDSGSIIVAVEDSGEGLAADAIDRVFEHFYTTKPEGLGIGLSISKAIIAAHGGRIWAANNPEGGARFSFTIPAHKENTR